VILSIYRNFARGVEWAAMTWVFGRIGDLIFRGEAANSPAPEYLDAGSVIVLWRR
jgi:hypothetical protein